jgi:hypothetical protein
MAQTNYTPISLYYSTTASAVPTAANLVPGELAINTNDGKLYYEDSSGVVQVLATKSTGSIGGSNTQVQFNNSGSLGGSSSFTWDGTTVTATKFAGALNGTVGATTPSTGAFTTLSTSSTTTFSGLTASTALALDASKNVVSVTNTGTGNNVLSASPTLTGTIAGASLSLSSLTSGRVTYATTAGLLTDSANLLYSGTDLTVYGLTVGRGAGAVSNNTALGVSALSGGSLSGGRNIGIGINAGNTLSSGSQNTFLGSYCGTGMTTGTQNIGIGDGALTGNSSGATGSYNIGIGALTALTSGSNNVGVGYQALNANNSASNNTAVGYQAGFNNTGDVNVYIGRIAGFSNTGSGANTFVGQNSGNAFNVASGNTFNSFFGCDSGQAITSGTKNTIIGAYSGNAGGLDIRTASNYIVLSDGDGNPRAYWNGADALFAGGLTLYKNSGGGSNTLSIQAENAAGANAILDLTCPGSNAGTLTYIRSTSLLQAQNGGSGGVTLASGGVAWIAVSDERKKENLVPIADAVTKVLSLRSVTGNYIADKKKVSKAFLIAQDVEAVFPEAVDKSDPDVLGLAYTDVIPLLVAAIKELKAEFDSYKATHP